MCSCKRHEKIWALYPPRPGKGLQHLLNRRLCGFRSSCELWSKEISLSPTCNRTTHFLSTDLCTHTPKGISVCSMACCAITSPNKIVLTGKLFTGRNNRNLCRSGRHRSTHHHQPSQWMDARLSCTQQNRLYPTTDRECVGNQTSSLACSTMYPSSSNKQPIPYCALRLTIKNITAGTQSWSSAITSD